METLSTTAPPSVTVFDERSSCDPSAEDLDVLRMQTLVAAYNGRDREALVGVMQPSDLFDATALPHVGALYSDSPLLWAEAGWAVNDQIELVEVRTYSGAGADGLLRRRNDLLEEVGIGWLVYSFKVQGRGCVIVNFVAHGPVANECMWYLAFHDQLLAFEEFVIPVDCDS